jgi:NAD+-dependent farnesol dehydrogenase
VKILVTGATGYLGRSILEACRRSGHETVAFSRRATRVGLPGAAIDGDVRDASAVRAAAAGCDAICHSAALVSVWRPRAEDFDEVNVGGLRHVLDAARAAGIDRIAYTSSFLALPPAGSDVPGLWNDYQRTKVLAAVEAERAVQQGVPLVRLFPGVLFGPGVMSDGNLVGRMVADHLAGRLPGVIGGGRTWSFAWVEEVAAAHVAALERGRPGARYCLGGENLPQMALFQAVRQRTGRNLPLSIPAFAAVPVALAQEWRAARTGSPPQLTVGTVEILDRDWPLDSRAAIHDLGYRITPFADGIGRVLDELLAGAATPRQEVE